MGVRSGRIATKRPQYSDVFGRAKAGSCSNLAVVDFDSDEGRNVVYVMKILSCLSGMRLPSLLCYSFWLRMGELSQYMDLVLEVVGVGRWICHARRDDGPFFGKDWVEVCCLSFKMTRFLVHLRT